MIRDEENCRVLEFGTGDILVSIAKLNDNQYDNCLCFSPQDPGPVGVEYPEHIGKTAEELKTKVMMVFNSVESLQVVTHFLDIIKEQMLREGQ
jgi:hypothetical protein